MRWSYTSPRPAGWRFGTDRRCAPGWSGEAEAAEDGLHEDGRRQDRDGGDADRGDDLEGAAVGGVAEDAGAVGEDEDVGEQDGGDEPVQDLGLDEELDEVAGDKGDCPADEDLAGEQAEEQRGLAEGLADAALGTGGLADGVGGRERDDRGG